MSSTIGGRAGDVFDSTGYGICKQAPKGWTLCSRLLELPWRLTNTGLCEKGTLQYTEGFGSLVWMIVVYSRREGDLAHGSTWQGNGQSEYDGMDKKLTVARWQRTGGVTGLTFV